MRSLLALLLLPLLVNAEPLTIVESGCGVTSVVEQYPVGNLFRYGAVGDGLTDTTAVWNRALCSVARSPTQRVLQIPTGSFRFGSRPDYITASMVIRGETTNTSVLIADYNETNAVLGFLQNNPGQGGIELRSFRVHKGKTVTGGAGIALVSSQNVAAGFIFIDSVIVTTDGGTWNYSLFIDGGAKTTAPSGVRGLQIDNSLFFGATSYAALFYSVNTARINASFIPAGGTTGKVLIGGTAAVPTTSFMMDAPFLTDLDLGYIDGAKIRIASQVNVNRSEVTLRTTVE